MLQEFTFVAGIHGNELAPYFALKDMDMRVILGNPRAAQFKKRFFEKDLNASFGSFGQSYEEQRARKLLSMIPKGPEIVDFHTFTSPSPTFCVLVDLKKIELTKRTGIKKVVYMNHDIKKGGSLISSCPGISIEVGTHEDEESFHITQNVVKTLYSGEKNEIELYEVFDVIEEEGEYINFVDHQKGFVPILTGESSYNNYGLKSRRIDL